MRGLEWSKGPESYAGGSVAAGRTGQERRPGPPGWGLGLRLTPFSCKRLTVQKPVLKPRKDGTTDDG